MQGIAEMACELRYKASEVPSSLDERATGMGLSSRKSRRYQSRLCKSQRHMVLFLCHYVEGE